MGKQGKRAGVEERLGSFLRRIGSALMNKPRARVFCTYVAGLLSSLDRKTAESIAVAATPDAQEESIRSSHDERATVRDVKRRHDRILHTIGKSTWDDIVVRNEAVRFALSSLSGGEKIEQLIVDDTGFIKQGTHTAGVQRQYTGSAGKVANCQVGVSVVACTATSQFPVDFALYVPRKWLTRKARKKAGIPDSVVFKTKPQLAGQMLARIFDTGLLPACMVSADSAYGSSSAFRNGLLERGCTLAVGVKDDAKAWSVDAGGSKRGPPTSLEAIALRLKYRRVAWRNGSKGPMVGRFGARRVIMEKGYDAGDPPDPVWLVVEKSSDDSKFHLVSAGPDATLKSLVATLKQRFRTERSYQDAKNEVGLSDYQGRSFVGWHHHITAVIAACAFLFSENQNTRKPPNTTSRREAVRTSERMLRHFPESFATLRRVIASALQFLLPRQPRTVFA